MAFFLSNNIKLYIEDGATVHKLSIQSDFNYNRSARFHSVNRNSMDPLGDRSVVPIIEEVGPIKFSFSTYAEIDDTGANVTSAQKLLWRGLLGSSNGLDEDTSRFLIQFGGSADLPSLAPLTFYIEHEAVNKVTQLSNVSIDSVTIDIQLDQLVNMVWKGTALDYAEGSLPSVDKDYTLYTSCMFTKLSTITLLRNAVNYNLALTGGVIDIDNNNVYFSKKEFGKSQAVIGHYTGPREIKGSLEFYTKTGTNASYDLFHALMTDATTDTTTAYAYDMERISDIQILLGASTGKHIQIDAPEAILSLPTQRFRNNLTMSVPFVVQESTGKEFEVRYIP